MRLLITRPAEDSVALAGALAERGIEVMLDPLLAIRYRDGDPLDLDHVQALLITSANGLRAFARRDSRRNLDVFAVGDASARAAREAGFQRVESAAGDVEALAELVASRLDPKAGVLLHVAGGTVAGDLATLLSKKRFDYRREVLYEAEKADRLAPETVQALQAGVLDGVLFYSPRTAATFVRLALKAGVSAACSGVSAFCLSAAVAERARGLPWRAVRVAERPEQASLLRVVDETLHPC